jgi:hypothetical protein
VAEENQALRVHWGAIAGVEFFTTKEFLEPLDVSQVEAAGCVCDVLGIGSYRSWAATSGMSGRLCRFVN